MSTDPTHYARQVVRDLAFVVEQLAASLLPGSGRSWRAPRLSADRRAELDRQAREEMHDPGDTLPAHLRQTQSVTAPGEHPVPFDLDVMDQLVEISAAAEVLAADLCRVVWRPADPGGRSAFADPRPPLHLVDRLLLEASVADDTVLFYVEQRCKALIERAQEALGLITDGQLLEATCPWCLGRTESQPVGGAHTLRIRNLRHTGGTVVVCEGGRCEPPDAECGVRVRGLPAWPEHEWEWLAMKIERTAS